MILLCLLSSCSMVRIGYDQGPQLAWWWLDGYVSFNNEQTPHAKEAIRKWFAWHRTTQLPEYAAWLSTLRSQISDPVTATQVCGWSEELRSTIAPAFDHTVQLGAPLVTKLGEAQWRSIEQRYAKVNEEFRHDFLQLHAEERLAASIKRIVKRVENMYGDIDESQHRLIVAGIEASPLDPERWLAERQRRQHETLSILRRLAAEQAETAHIVTALRGLIERVQRSDDEDYRAYQLKLMEYNCAFIADVHNSTTPIQRQHAHDKLKDWETDLRKLANTI